MEQVHRFVWQGIEIEAVYEPESLCGMAHLAIRSVNPERAALPITETGYLSHFHPRGTVEANSGGVAAQVMAWLDEEAAKPEWKRHVEKARQFELF